MLNKERKEGCPHLIRARKERIYFFFQEKSQKLLLGPFESDRQTQSGWGEACVGAQHGSPYCATQEATASIWANQLSRLLGLFHYYHVVSPYTQTEVLCPLLCPLLTYHQCPQQCLTQSRYSETRKRTRDQSKEREWQLSAV